MGVNVVNNTGGVEHFEIVNGQIVLLGFAYHLGRGSPAFHEASPTMTLAEVQAVRDAAKQGTEQQWLDAHPAAVKTWLQGQPALARTGWYTLAKRPLPT